MTTTQSAKAMTLRELADALRAKQYTNQLGTLESELLSRCEAMGTAICKLGLDVLGVYSIAHDNAITTEEGVMLAVHKLMKSYAEISLDVKEV